jgi:hypothetical protein
MRRKIDFYGEIQGELGVIMAFSKIHEELGFSKLIPSSSKGFDIDSIEYNGSDVTVEFEYLSSNFISHGHQTQMDDKRNYVVICWEDDCGLITKLRDEYGKKLYDLISIRKYVNIKNEITASQPTKALEETKYAVMSYNPNVAGKDFSAWAFSHCYRVTTSKRNPKFADDKLPPGSKILFYQNGFIIGGFTVVRYEIIKRPKTEREWVLYKKLTDYPASLYTVSIEEYKEYDWLNGHIYYTDFFDIRDFKIRFSHFVKKKMSRHGKINLTRDEYFRIVGH